MSLLPEYEVIITRRSFPMRCPAGSSALGLALAVSLGARGGSTPGPLDAPPAPPTDDVARLPDEISREEILLRGTPDPTAYALIRRLRPTWLLARGQTSFTNGASSFPVVYVDGILRGGLATLHQVAPNQIKRMEFIGPGDATTRWGTGHRSGVINVVTGR